jgi:transcriptional regulator with XRE-family HTH domain
MPGADGGTLREWRRSRGWDVPEMARRLRRAAGDNALPEHDALVRMIRRWERGTYAPSERYELLYAAAFGVPPGQVRSGPRAAPQRRAAAPSMAPDPPGIVAAIGEALHTAGGDVPPQRDLAALMRDVGRAWELRQSAEYTRLGALLTSLLRDTAAWTATAPGNEQAAAASVHVNNMVSSMLKRFGAYEMGAVVADRAFRAAAETGNGLLTGAARLRVANVYLSASRHAEAVAVAAAAADSLPPRDSSAPAEIATFGALLLTAAVAAARMGEAAQAWEFLGHAQAATAICNREHADLFAVFGPVNLAVHGVQVATELGDGREALCRAEKTDPGRLPAVLLERRSTLLIDMARAQHMQHDAAAAGETLIEAERVAPLEVRYSGAARSLLGELLAGGRAPAALREMAGRLNVAA